MQPRNAEVLRQIIDVQDQMAPLIETYKNLVFNFKEVLDELPPGAIHAIAAYHGLKDHEVVYPGNHVTPFLEAFNKVHSLCINLRDDKIDKNGHVITDPSKHVPITFEEEPPVAIPAREPEGKPVSPASLAEIYAIIDAAIKEKDPDVMESLEESLEEIGHHSKETLKNVRREGIEVKGEIEFSDDWEGTITATISLLGAFQAITGTRIPHPIQNEIDRLEHHLEDCSGE